MKQRILKRLVTGAFVAVVFLVGVGSTTADAQTRYIYRYPRPYFHRVYDPFWNPWGPNYIVTVVDPIAAQREQGYSDGHTRGKDDAKHGKANDPASHKHYNKSHSLTYRQAFLKGYAEGYREQMDRTG
jgi:hypothetical protein